MKEITSLVAKVAVAPFAPLSYVSKTSPPRPAKRGVAKGGAESGAKGGDEGDGEGLERAGKQIDSSLERAHNAVRTAVAMVISAEMLGNWLTEGWPVKAEADGRFRSTVARMHLTAPPGRCTLARVKVLEAFLCECDSVASGESSATAIVAETTAEQVIVA